MDHLLLSGLFRGFAQLICNFNLGISGNAVHMVHMCLLLSLYSFEYKWFNQGLELHKRLTYVENNWPYFLGFGFPLAVLTNMSESVVVSGCVFSILFPLFIVSGNQAQGGDSIAKNFP